MHGFLRRSSKLSARRSHDIWNTPSPARVFRIRAIRSHLLVGLAGERNYPVMSTEDPSRRRLCDVLGACLVRKFRLTICTYWSSARSGSRQGANRVTRERSEGRGQTNEKLVATPATRLVWVRNHQTQKTSVLTDGALCTPTHRVLWSEHHQG